MFTQIVNKDWNLAELLIGELSLVYLLIFYV